MTDIDYSNIVHSLQQKRLSLDMSKCPFGEEHINGYKEGWINAFIFAEQIIREELLKEK